MSENGQAGGKRGAAEGEQVPGIRKTNDPILENQSGLEGKNEYIRLTAYRLIFSLFSSRSAHFLFVISSILMASL